MNLLSITHHITKGYLVQELHMVPDKRATFQQNSLSILRCLGADQL